MRRPIAVATCAPPWKPATVPARWRASAILPTCDQTANDRGAGRHVPDEYDALEDGPPMTAVDQVIREAIDRLGVDAVLQRLRLDDDPG